MSHLHRSHIVANHRLAGILRAFRLPFTATKVEFRQAYLQEAKRLHPDVTKSAPPHQDFTDLQERFEEGARLFDQIEQLASQKRQTVDTSLVGRAYSTSSEPQMSQPIVATGMPAFPVYAACGSLSLAAALWWASNSSYKQKPVPVKEEYHDVTPDKGGKQATLSNYAKAVPWSQPRGEILGQVEPQVRDGVELSAAHVAAEDGGAWWLERCWASETCRKSLSAGDKNLDTPLHHCARSGQQAACEALLRHGANTSVENKWRLLPEELAALEGHDEVEELIRSLRIEQEQNASESDPSKIITALSNKVKRHPDGLGILSVPPNDLPYGSPHPANSLRYAVNLASGFTVLRHQKLDKATLEDLPPEPVQGVSREIQIAVESARMALKGTGFDVENAPVDPELMCYGGEGWKDQPSSCPAGKYTNYDQQFNLQMDEVCGLIGLELGGQVTPDAPDHWFAVRISRGPSQKQATHQGGVGLVVNLSGRDRESIFRLDPVRGPYELTTSELTELTRRYKLWRVIRRERLRATELYTGRPTSGKCTTGHAG